MSRVLLRGRRFDSGGAGSNRVCNGWDWTHSACTIIRVAITSRPLKQVGRFILFSPFVWDNNLQCFYGISFFCCFFWKNNHFWNFAIRRQHFRDGCIEIRQRTSTAEEVSKARVLAREIPGIWSTWSIHIHRETYNRVEFFSSRNSSTPQMCRLIVIVCCWRLEGCRCGVKPDSVGTATLLLLPSALAIQLACR